MDQPKHQYNLKTILGSVLIWEVVFWLAFVGLYFYLIEQVDAFRFENKPFLWAMLIVPVLILGFSLILIWKNKVFKRLADARLLSHLTQPISSTKSFWKFFFLRNAIVFLIIAFANPQYGKGETKAVSEGIEIMIALDISNSMRALDLDPKRDRLKLAKMAIEKVLGSLHGDKVGIVLFAGDAFVQVPLTVDYGLAKMFLSSVRPEMMSNQGTAIGLAIEKCMASFDFENGINKSIIIISDGEDHEDVAIEAAKFAYEDNVIISTVGMGKLTGTPIPDYQNGRIVGMKKDFEGNTVTTKLNEKMLQDIAASGGGEYTRAQGSYVNLNGLLESIRKIEKTELESKLYTDYKDQFQWFLGLGLICLLSHLLISERRSGVIYKLQKI
ncbi:vWA domain-containing protein [Crocinitomix catalasitica]|uniref:vWA domain-containing protein n=1 Tax=Crocinitomix catalasitica TaxID=184607 RepID=UPI000A013358|nr:VWA domain-containing protein [Crocinitomix catalasitica]